MKWSLARILGCRLQLFMNQIFQMSYCRAVQAKGVQSYKPSKFALAGDGNQTWYGHSNYRWKRRPDPNNFLSLNLKAYNSFTNWHWKYYSTSFEESEIYIFWRLDVKIVAVLLQYILYLDATLFYTSQMEKLDQLNMCYCHVALPMLVNWYIKTNLNFLLSTVMVLIAKLFVLIAAVTFWILIKATSLAILSQREPHLLRKMPKNHAIDIYK